MKQNRILITGACGFIGTHLAQRCHARGVPLVLLDNFSTGSRENLEWIRDCRDIEFVESDLGDPRAVREIIASCNQVIHLAALTSVALSMEEPRRTHINNVDTTLTLLEQCHDAGIERVVVSSSASVYGDSSESVLTEQTRLNPMSPYAMQKLSCEFYVRLFSERFGVGGTSLRLFNVYGPGQFRDAEGAGVVSRFCHEMLAGRRPVVTGTGLQTRDFVFVDDVVDAILSCLGAPLDKVAGQCFNIGSGQSVSLLQLVELINAITDQDLQPVFVGARSGDVIDSRADISAAKRAIEFSPRVSLEDGLRRTIAHEQSALVSL